MKRLYSFLAGILAIILVLWGISYHLDSKINSRDSQKLVLLCLNKIKLIINYNEFNGEIFNICSLESEEYLNSTQRNYGFNIKIEDVEFSGIITIESCVDEHSGCLIIPEIKLQTLLPTKTLQNKVKDFISQNNTLACFQIATVNSLK